MELDLTQAIDYNFAVIPVTQNQPVDVDRRCNGFTAINTGTTLAILNGIPLNAGVPGTSNGDSITIGGNKGELFRGRIDVAFTGGVGSVLIIQKFYL